MFRLLLLLVLSGTLWASETPNERSDSGIQGPPYETILAEMDRLAAAHSNTQVIEYGTTPKGRPLKLLLIAEKGASWDRPAVLISGATHGNEYLGFEDKLAEALLTQSTGAQHFLNEGGVFIIVPILNPDGYAKRTRGNAHGKDLNRDWDIPPANYIGFKEPETAALSKKIQELRNQMDLRFELTVDYHCCIGALLHPWSYKNESLPKVAKERHEAIQALASQHLGISIGTTNDVLGYAPLGTTKDHYFSLYGSRAFTYEGRHGKEDKYFPKHVQWWDAIARYLAHEAPAPLFSINRKRQRDLARLAD